MFSPFQKSKDKSLFVKTSLIFSRAVLQLCSLNGFFLGEVSRFLARSERLERIKPSDWLRDKVIRQIARFHSLSVTFLRVSSFTYEKQLCIKPTGFLVMSEVSPKTFYRLHTEYDGKVMFSVCLFTGAPPNGGDAPPGVPLNWRGAPGGTPQLGGAPPGVPPNWGGAPPGVPPPKLDKNVGQNFGQKMDKILDKK